MTSYSTIPELQILAVSFVDRCKSLNAQNLSLHPYNKKYLERYLEKIEYNTYIASSIAEHFWGLKNSRMIDFGGGVGFNSAFFKHVGFENVVHLDHDEHCVADARKIHKALSLGIDNYICGGLQWVSTQNLDKTLIASRDVIEHVYNLEEFFTITKKARLNAHNTAAIHNSIFRKNEFEQIHHKAEHTGFVGEGIKEMDSQIAYAQMRLDYLSVKVQQKERISQLVEETRGLTFTDIDSFLQSYSYNALCKKHLYSNTCNPETGNWAERTLPLSAYNSFGNAAGIDTLKVDLLKYNTFTKSALKKTALSVLNWAVQKSNIQRLAPSFTLVY